MTPCTVDHGDLLPPGWTYLDREQVDEAWSRFRAAFGALRPGLHADAWPAITEPAPSVTFDLRFDATAVPAIWAARMEAINAETVRCLLGIADPSEVVVLDWQHPGYRLDLSEHASAPDAVWGVPVYPDGDYYTFVLPDFSEGTFGHPWEQSLCVFGPRLVGTLAVTLSTWLPVLRVDGRTQQDNPLLVDDPPPVRRPARRFFEGFTEAGPHFAHRMRQRGDAGCSDASGA
ncbi:Protein of unknown function [Rhodococcoides kroppenstedtii]|uniref:DUF2716 domain-containing protein n=1 Tax=Rhodococcoides kroppenstedtii TaxID=293050 RepID=A0A1I0SKN0_9NOCA|nr:DUF2716 domain-containing protein [Rhodococcus kroppenstedtii]SFA40059.1 Protein of unknown function [Rhodococcus kroppenstedtii]